MTQGTSEEDLSLFCQIQYPSLVGLLSFFCGDRWVAEELAQEALARLCRDWRKVRSMDNPEAWLRRVAINQAKSRYRRRVAEHRAAERIRASRLVPNQEHDPAESIAMREEISALPHRQKTVLVLRYYGGLSFPEIASTLDLPEGTVKSHARRALQRLRRELDLADQEEEEHAKQH